MTKTIGIETDRDGTKYLAVREDERADPDSKHITLETSRDRVVVIEREGRIKQRSHVSGYREDRPSTFKGADAPAKAAQYLIQKYNLTIVEVRGHP